jgi:hypothetical protein
LEEPDQFHGTILHLSVSGSQRNLAAQQHGPALFSGSGNQQKQTKKTKQRRHFPIFVPFCEKRFCGICAFLRQKNLRSSAPSAVNSQLRVEG